MEKLLESVYEECQYLKQKINSIKASERKDIKNMDKYLHIGFALGFVLGVIMGIGFYIGVQ